MRYEKQKVSSIIYYEPSLYKIYSVNTIFWPALYAFYWVFARSLPAPSDKIYSSSFVWLVLTSSEGGPDHRFTKAVKLFAISLHTNTDTNAAYASQ